MWFYVFRILRCGLNLKKPSLEYRQKRMCAEWISFTNVFDIGVCSDIIDRSYGKVVVEQLLFRDIFKKYPIWIELKHSKLADFRQYFWNRVMAFFMVTK